jgi:outer membrane lipoprotein-sorting protein
MATRVVLEPAKLQTAIRQVEARVGEHFPGSGLAGLAESLAAIERAIVLNGVQAEKNRAAFESFLVLGFGGRGHDLPKSYDIKYLGKETIGGVETDQLELTPKSEKVRNQFSQILLWIDPKQGISLQQKLMQPSGDYRLAKYTKIVVNQKLSDGVFKLKTTPKTTVLSPQG